MSTWEIRRNPPAPATTAKAIVFAQSERAKGASLDAIADACRVSRRTVYRWLAGHVETVMVGGWTADYVVDAAGPHRASRWRRSRRKPAQ
jgi:hypothetical protein